MMESGCFDRPHTRNIPTLQRFEEIMYEKKMEIAALDLQVQSCKQNLLRFKGTDLGVRDNGYGTNLSQSFPVNNCIDESKLHKESRVLSLSLGVEALKVGLESKIGGDSHKGKVGLSRGEIEQLCMRLQTLEEDNEIIKKEFIGSVKERSELLSEISQRFQIICQHLSSRVNGKKSLVGSLILSLDKDGNTFIGLAQVLHQDTNPSLITRVLKANTFAFHGPIREMQEN